MVEAVGHRRGLLGRGRVAVEPVTNEFQATLALALVDRDVLAHVVNQIPARRHRGLRDTHPHPGELQGAQDPFPMCRLRRATVEFFFAA